MWTRWHTISLVTFFISNICLAFGIVNRGNGILLGILLLAGLSFLVYSIWYAFPKAKDSEVGY